MKCLALLFLLFCSAVPKGNAQPSVAQRATDSTRTLVQQFYNAGQPDSIYALTNAGFQSQFTAGQFREFITEAKAGLGQWQSSQLPKFAGNTWHYKAFFRNAVMDFLLQLDAQRKISLFALQPYQPPISRKAKVLTNNPLRTPLDRQVDEAMRDYVTDDRIVGLSIGILRNDSLFTFGYGETAKGNQHIPDDSILFEIGSVTKTFTAALLAEAVQRGVVRLDDPVSQYLPDSIPPLRYKGLDITLKMLANHTSGLPRMATNWDTGATFSEADPYAVYDEHALFSYLNQPGFAHKPGTTYAYSNVGMGLLATILTRQAGKSYEQLLADVITEPLQLNNTKITLTADDQQRMAQGYNEAEMQSPIWNFRSLAGAGAIRSTTLDLLRYLQANLGKASAKLVADFTLTHKQTFAGTDPVQTVGLGWNIINKTGWWWHNGGTGGFRSFIGFNPTKKTAFALLANSVVRPLDGLDWKLIKAAGL